MPAIQLTISGKVQGVFFRASARKKADQLGITGWVRNTSEGHVDIFAQGTDQQLEKFLEWCKEGPQLARVDKVISMPADDQILKEFKILH